MFTLDTLVERASANLFGTAESRLNANTVFRAQATPLVVPEGDLQQAGAETPRTETLETRMGGRQPELSSKKAIPENIRYYDLKRNWTRKIEPILDDKELNDILSADFNKFTWGRLRMKFGAGQLPHEFESQFGFFWQRGRFARYRWYTRHGACHWLVNFALRLAILAIPSQHWRIITSDAHSTVWNGRNCLFDFNWFFMGLPAGECYESANDEELAPGEYLKVGLADPDAGYYAQKAIYEREWTAATGAKLVDQQAIR